MASSSSSNFSILIFLLLIACTLSFFSLQIQARQFFSKVSGSADDDAEPVAVPVKQKATPEEEQRQDDHPTFYAQTTESSYGLYGNYKPYVTPVRYHPDEPYNAIPTNNNINNKQNSLEEEARLGQRNTHFYNNEDDENSSDQHANGGKLNKDNLEENKAMLGSERNSFNNNGEQQQVSQGMSDTRFLENGKYYYDINTEIRNTNYPDHHQTHDDATHHPIYHNNNARPSYYGNLQGSPDNRNYQHQFQQFNDDQP